LASSRDHTVNAAEPVSIASPWEPFQSPAFRMLWTATVISNVGTWMHDIGAAWLMTSLTERPMMIALVQAATSLPMVFLALPAGALADIVDRRRYLLVLQFGMLVSAALLAVVVFLGLASPWALLLFTFALGAGAALMAPAWQAVTPELVSREALPAALVLNSAGTNVSRAIGPALGGLLIARAGPAAVFTCNALSFLAIIAALLRWQRTLPVNPLPAEHFIGAMRAGLRYVWQSPPLHRVLVRTAVFFVFASAMWALLPLIARSTLKQGPGGYGVLLALLGLGAVMGAFILPHLRSRCWPDHLMIGGTLVFSAATAALGLFPIFAVACGAMAMAGMAWISVLSCLNIAAQQAVPVWVRARALSVYLIVFFGGMAVGSTLWGALAARVGIQTSLVIAAAGLLLGLLLVRQFSLGQGDGSDLAPSVHWPAPVVAVEPDPDRGPVLVTIEYHIAPEQTDAFAQVMSEVRRMRLRDGAFAWGLFASTADPTRVVESFWVESWLEHLRQHARVSVADEGVQNRANAFHIGPEPPAVSHHISILLPRGGA
jgi:MFS family permease